MPSVERPVDVAVAILVRPDGSVLLAQRPASKVYAGYWEFPGGKVEPGESVARALARELHEELGVEVRRAYPWITRVYTDPHATVRLHFHRVVDWTGALRCKEHQAVAWQRLGALDVTPLLPANDPVLKALALPAEYAVSNATGMGQERFLAALDRRFSEGLRLVQVREKALPRAALQGLVAQVVAAAHAAEARVLVNGDAEVAAETGADGVHLTEGQLMAIDARPVFDIVGASCHTSAALRRAESLGVDFAVLGPVRATPTHPRGALLGWDGFAMLAADAGLPIYAIGGLTREDYDTACSHGAHGLAMIRGSWEG